jgi:hypothetical protein
MGVSNEFIAVEVFIRGRMDHVQKMTDCIERACLENLIVSHVVKKFSAP